LRVYCKYGLLLGIYPQLKLQINLYE